MKFLLAIALALGIAAAAYGAAATLLINGGTLQSGTVSAICDSSVDVTYDISNPDVDSVNVEDIDSDCEGDTITITVNYDTDADNVADLSVFCSEVIDVAQTTVSYNETVDGGNPGNCDGTLPASITVVSLISVEVLIN
ncbi:MAG TPA: hypothetical protein VJB57_16935 [Dehalococcoidia bacterium]|nr:hypothetical protein [Dehalococcoidia bacterium]